MSDPLRRLAEWYEAAIAAGVEEANAMALATATPDGAPSVRIVLMKAVDDRGVQFFTNYESRKGRELEANPRAAATLYWQPQHRAVRLEGAVERVSAEESDAYFHSRPRGSRVGARASQQGRPLSAYADLETAFAAESERFPGDEVPRPAYWGGFRIVPVAIELWQGMPSRLHDRVHWVRESPEAPWREGRLFP